MYLFQRLTSGVTYVNVTKVSFMTPLPLVTNSEFH